MIEFGMSISTSMSRKREVEVEAVEEQGRGERVRREEEEGKEVRGEENSEDLLRTAHEGSSQRVSQRRVRSSCLQGIPNHIESPFSHPLTYVLAVLAGLTGRTPSRSKVHETCFRSRKAFDDRVELCRSLTGRQNRA
jgi:hypothetical protein